MATFNDYYRNELKVESDREYVLSGSLWNTWDESHRQPDVDHKVPVANTGVDLAHAMVMNPKMKVLVQQGYFDLACRYGTVEDLRRSHERAGRRAPQRRDRVSRSRAPMYVHPASMVKFKKDLASFVDATSR